MKFGIWVFGRSDSTYFFFAIYVLLVSSKYYFVRTISIHSSSFFFQNLKVYEKFLNANNDTLLT